MSIRLKIYAILRYTFIFLIATLLVFSIYTCSDDEENDPISPKTVSARFEIRLAPSGIAIEELTAVKLIISGDSMDTIQTNLTLDKIAGKASGAVDVPLGDNRLFRVEVYAGTFLRFVGEQKSNVRGTLSIQIPVDIKPANGVGVIAIGEQVKGTGLVIAVGDINIFLSQAQGNLKFIQNLAKKAGTSPKLKLDLSHGTALEQKTIDDLENALSKGGFQPNADESDKYDTNAYDAVLFALPIDGFTSGQLSDISAFVNKGGMLILVADTEQPLEALNQIANQFGLDFEYSLINAQILDSLSSQSLFDGVSELDISFARSINISPSGGNNVKVYVSATPGPDVVATPDEPKLLIAPTQVNLGTILKSAQVDIGNSGTGSISWNIRETGIPEWLTISPMSGKTTAERKIINVTITADRTGLDPDEYRHNVTVESNAGNGNLLVIMTVPEPDPLLSFTPKFIDFGTTDTKKTFTITNNGGGTLDWKVSNSQAWLKADPTSASLKGGQTSTVTLTIDRANLKAGNFTDKVAITSNGGNGEVAVSMTVPEPDPSISVTPLTIDFGTTDTQKTFAIANNGGGTLDWNASKQQAWLIINPTQGSLKGGLSANVTLTVNRANLDAGTYRDVVSVTSNGGNVSVNVSMTVPEPSPSLAFTPTSIDFGTAETAKTFTISNNGGGTLNWNASKKEAWLTISLVSGSLTGGKSVTVNLSVNRSGLNPGAYKDTVALTSNGGNGNLSISMTVPEPDPKLSFTPDSLDFGTTQTQQTVTITNDGGGTLTWQASKKEAWLTVNPASGSLKGGEKASLTLIVNRGNLAPGAYNDTLALTSNGGNGSVRISMTIPEPSPKLLVSASSVDFGVSDTTKLLTVTNEGGGTLDWKADKKEAWLTVLPVSGSLTLGKSGNVTITVNRFAVDMVPGTYRDVVAFTSNGGNVNVNISMTIPEPATVLSYSPQTIDFGTTDTSKSFTITNNGGGTLDWKADKKEAWLTLSLANASLTTGKSSTVTLTVNRANLNPGSYRDVVSLTSNGGNGSVTVTMTVPEPAPKLSVSPTTIDFGTENTQATVTIQNSGGQTLTWQTSKKEAWLTISPLNGSLAMGKSATITLNVTRTNLKSGAYKDVIAITSNGGSANVNVAMTIPEPPPVFSSSPNSIDFGTTDTQKVLTITNTGGGTLDWKSSKQQAWLTVSPVSGSLSAGKSVEVSISVSRLGLAPNSYKDTISLTSNGGNGSVAVSMTVQLTNPTLSFTPASLDFGATDTQKTFTISNSGGGTLTWSLSRQQSWLTISPLVGSLDAGKSVTITATVSRVRLSPADYKDTITITTNAGNAGLPVTMKVPEPPPTLSFAPTSINFGDTNTQATLTITNSGGEILTWNASVNQSWLSLSPASGSLALGKSVNVIVKADRSTLKPGSLSGAIALTSNGGNGSVPITLLMPGLSLTPTSLVFASTDTSKIVTIKNIGAGNLSWKATKSASWLTLSSTGSTLAANASTNVTVSVNREGLNPADYTDSIAFTSNGGNGNVAVSMPIPGLGFTPVSLSFDSSETQKTLTLKNNGGGTLTWTASKKQAWLTLEPATGAIKAGASANVVVNVSRAGMAPGAYSDMIVLTSDGGNANIPVSMLVAGFLVSASVLDFGSLEEQKLLTITNNGNGVLEWQATKKESWLTVEPVSGKVDAGRSSTLTVKVARAGLKSGNHTDAIVFSSNAGERRTTVNVSVAGLSYALRAYNFGASQTRSTLTITNTGEGSLSWSVTKTQSWLTISPTSGFVSAGESFVATVTVSRVGLQPGTYNDTMSLKTNGGNAEIPVRMDVAGLSYTPTSFSFGALDKSKILTIKNIGAGALTWTASKKQTWLSISPATGSVNEGESADVTVAVDQTDLKPGNYTDTISLVTNGGNADIPITLSLPQLSIITNFISFGATDAQKTFAISNTGGGNLIWQSSVKEPWLKLNPSSGSIASGQSINITATASRNDMLPGFYSDKALFTSNGGDDSVDAFLSVAGMSINPTSLTFLATETQKTLAISNTGAGTLTWQATDDGSWLTLNPTSGSVEPNSPINVTVTVSRTGLNPGTIIGNILFSSNGGNVTVPITMIVASPTISINPESLNFGTQTTTATFQVLNIGAGTLNWNITSASIPQWANISPTSGATIAGTPTTVTVTVSRRGLDSETYTATIPIASNGGNASLNIIMSVADPILSVDPDTLNFGTNIDEDTFTIDNIGGGNLKWSIVQDIPAWLNLAVTAPPVGVLPDGRTVVEYTPQEIVVLVDRTIVAPGNYRHNIRVLSNGGNKVVLVTMTVPPPTLRVSPTSINFGQTATSRPLDIINDGGGVLSWTATTTVASRQGWLYIEDLGVEEWDGVSRAYSPRRINIVIHRDLVPGNYEGFIDINSNGNPNKSARVRVTMTVPEFEVPIVPLPQAPPKE